MAENENIQETVVETPKKKDLYKNYSPSDIELLHKNDEANGRESVTLVMPKDLVQRPLKLDENRKPIEHLATKKDGSPALDGKGNQKKYFEHYNFISMPEGLKVADENQQLVDVSGYIMNADDKFVSKNFSDDSKTNIFIPLTDKDNIWLRNPEAKDDIVKLSPDVLAASFESCGAKTRQVKPRTKKQDNPNVDLGKGRERVETKKPEGPSNPEKIEKKNISNPTR